MELVTVKQLRSGYVVATAVTNAKGAVLCPAGFTLTDQAIERLKNAGVEDVVIQGTARKGPSTADRLAALHRRFSDVDDPILLQIKATIENRLNLM